MSKFKARQKRPVAVSGYQLTTLALTITDICPGGMSKNTLPPVDLQIPATVTTLASTTLKKVCNHDCQNRATLCLPRKCSLL